MPGNDVIGTAPQSEEKLQQVVQGQDMVLGEFARETRGGKGQHTHDRGTVRYRSPCPPYAGW
jgi:hypothetical protein